MPLPALKYLTQILLRHHGDCSLIGVLPNLTIYAEESYGDGWMAQIALRLDGTMVADADECGGENADIEPLVLPTGLIRPATRQRTARLNFSGPRHRGQREAERLSDLVRPLSLQDKMALTGRYGLPLAAPMILGLAESYVLAEARLAPDLDLVCRRLRIAYALAPAVVDGEGQTYDYDTAAIYVAHVVEASDGLEADFPGDGNKLPGATLHRPMDCLVYQEHLFVADGGEANKEVDKKSERLSTIYVWQLI